MNSSVSRLLAPSVLELNTLKTEDDAIESLVPDGLWWVYLIGPPLFVALLSTDLLMNDPETAIRALMTTYVHTTVVAGPIHFAYLQLLPRLFVRTRKRWHRILIQIAMVAIVVPVATLTVKPLMARICPMALDMRKELVHCYVLTALILFAALGYQRLRKRAQEIERLAMSERQAGLTAQLRALQARTNPHFLFNSLNAIASLIPKDPARAEQLTERLADVLRYSLQRTKRSLVHLEEEIEVVKEYLEIEAVRFGERLSWRIDVDPRVKRLRIPPMALEPLVENAVLHGIGSKREGGTVEIQAQVIGPDLWLSVTDDGPGCGSSAHAGTGTGLEDLRERLRLIYGRDDLLLLDRGPHGGCRATLTLPTAKR